MVKLESYAVFEGGGIKGFAFTGVLDAANESGINFVGYAGTSAGAIIAFLASIGYSGKEIYDELKNLDFERFANNETASSIKNLKMVYNDVSNIDSSGLKRGLSSKLFYYAKVKSRLPVIKMFKDVRKLFNKLNKDRGLFPKDNLVRLLANLAGAKINLGYYFPQDRGAFGSVTFIEHFNQTGVDLRVIATDVFSGRAIEFSYADTPNTCVIQAICASCAFPVFFEPTELNGYYLVDGGLSCNLPSYIFHKKKHKRLPVYAFDLVSSVQDSKNLRGYNIFKHIKNMVYAALDASNNIISNVVEGIAVPIKISAEINTLDLNIRSSQLDQLYESGYYEAKKFFNSHNLTHLYNSSLSKNQVGRLIYGRAESLLYYFGRDLPLTSTTKIWLYASITADDSEIISIGKWAKGFLNVQKIIKKIPSNDKPTIPFIFQYVHQSDHVFHFASNDKKQVKNECLTSWRKKSITVSYSANKTRVCYPIFQYGSDEVFALISISFNSHYSECLYIEDKSLPCSEEIILDIDSKFAILLEELSELIRSSLYGQQSNFMKSFC